MAAIVTRLEGIPDPDAIPFHHATEVPEEITANKAYVNSVRTLFAKIYRELERDDYTVPAVAADVITRPALEDALREAIGVELKLELENDPAGRGYAGKSDEDVLELLNDPYERTNLQTAGTVPMVIAEIVSPGVFRLTDVDGKDIDFKPFGNALHMKLLALGEGTTLEGQKFPITKTKKNTLSANLPTPPAIGGSVTIEDSEGGELTPRAHAILIRFPFAPNAFSAEDVAAARK